jgi:hypothetical protein
MVELIKESCDDIIVANKKREKLPNSMHSTFISLRG